MFENDDLGDRRLGEFRLLRRLGRGGMAEVYLAEQSSLNRRVALKVLRAELVTDEVHLKRFAREARAAGGLNHANIVQVYSIGEEEGVHYIAQEYVQGHNLAQFLQRKGPPDLRVAIHVMKQAAQALRAAGEAGIVHRDIKPENILITRKGQVKITDFGLAQLAISDERINLTQDGLTMGTPLYMSPEQINGGDLDVRSDIYSLGVTCYHLLAGRPPFRGETAMSLAVQHVNEKPVPLEQVRPDLPLALCCIVSKMMAKAPADRYFQATDLLDDLRSLSKSTDDEPPDAAMSRLAKLNADGPKQDSILFNVLGRMPGGTLAQKILSFAVASLVLAAFSAGVGWWARPIDPLSVPAGNQVSEPREGSAIEQYYRAMALETDEQAWLAVVHHWPDETEFVDSARAQLASLYLQTDRFNKAGDIFAELSSEEQSDPALRAQGYAGLAIIAAVNGHHEKSHRIITEQLLPLHDQLGETSRNLVLETIAQNRAALGNVVENDLEARFQPFPEPGMPTRER